MRLFLCVISMAALSSCTWVKVSDQGSNVALVKSQVVADCKKLGKTTSNSTHKLGIVKRHQEKVQQELIVLAKNQAASMGGNTITADSEMAEGKQTFMVYDCDK